MAMRGDKGTLTSLVTPSIQSINVSSRIELPNVVRSHPAVTPHEQDAGAALVTLAGLTKPAATKVKTEPHTPRNTNLQPTFPELVHAMIMETAVKQPDLIDWVHDGEAFVFLNPVRENFDFVYVIFQDFIVLIKVSSLCIVSVEE
jgi:hypothetical protein